MADNIFGACQKDRFVTWNETFDENGNPVVIFTSADGETTLELCLDPVKGATIGGEPVEIVNGVLQLPADMFGGGVLSADGETYTITFPGQAPQDLCVNPVKGAVIDGVTLEVVDGILQLPVDLFGSGVVSADGTTYTITLPGQDPVDICLTPVKSVTGPNVDNTDPQNVIVNETTVVDNGDGTGTVTDSQGSCVFVKGPIAQADVTDNGDGTGTVTDANGDACVFQKNQTVISDNGDGTWSFVNADGSTGDITTGTVVDNGDNTGTVTFPNGTTCTFLKDIEIPADIRVTGITFQENADGSMHDIILQLSDGSTLNAGPVVDADTFAMVADNADGTGTVTDPAGNACTFVKGPVVFEYVAYDAAVHDIGPVEGAGSAANPWQVPVKECNFEFVAYDPAVHVEGQVIGGTGTVADPWLIPVKECNFVYVPYDATIHDNGLVEGDGTAANPWQIPVKEYNFEFVTYDPAVHTNGSAIEGEGTIANPWLIPVKECNFVYVPYDATIHDAGVIQGDGSVANPWQIPLPPISSFTDKLGNAITTGAVLLASDFAASTAAVGDVILAQDAAGNCKTIPAKECEFNYVQFDPSIHDAGPVEGDGTLGNPWQLPLPKCDFHSLTADVYDPASEPTAPSNPPATKQEGSTLIEKMDGAVCYYTCVGGSWVLDFCCPSVTKEEIVSAFEPGDCASAMTPVQLLGDDCKKYDPCLLIPDHIFGKCSALGEIIEGPVAILPDKSLSMTLLDTCQYGSMVAGSGPIVNVTTFGPEVKNSFIGNILANGSAITFDVPAHNPDCVLALHMSWGTNGSTYPLQGPIVTPVGDYPNPKQNCLVESIGTDGEVFPDANGVGHAVYMWDGTGGAAGQIDVAFTLNANLYFASQGVLMLEWVEICDTNGAACTCADFDFGSIQSSFTDLAGDSTTEDNTPLENGDVSEPIDFGDCDAIYFGSGRHARYEGQTDFTNTSAPGVHPNLAQDQGDWFQYNGPAGTDQEAYQLVSHSSGTCQMGTTAGVVQGGNGAWTYTHYANNITGATTALSESDLCFIPTNCREPLGEQVSDSSSCSVPMKNTNCLKDAVMRCCLTGGATLELSPGDSVVMVPVFNGVECLEAAETVVNGANVRQTLNVSTKAEKTDYSNVVLKNCGQATADGFFRFYITSRDANQAPVITLNDWCLECELVHI